MQTPRMRCNRKEKKNFNIREKKIELPCQGEREKASMLGRKKEPQH
jgi:hypothetical protein